MIRKTLAAAGLMLFLSIPARASAQQPGDLTRQLNRSGPRFGVTWLGGALTDTIKSRFDTDVSPIISQFGWQYEKQFASLESGPVALNEWVFLIGGLDQGAFLPSLTWLVGIRSTDNFEFGVGPNATPAGVALAVSMGKTFRSGALAIPVNFAIVPSRFGTRISVLTGFNIYR